MNARLSATPFVAVVLLALLAACGGGAEVETEAAATPTARPTQTRAPLFRPTPPLFEREIMPEPSVTLPEPTVQNLPVTIWTSVAIDAEVTPRLGDYLCWFSGEEIRTETQCEYDDEGDVTGATTTITVSPEVCWENWEGAPLTYNWSASNGSISGSGLIGTWSRSVESGWTIEGTATLTVSDGTDGPFGPGGAYTASESTRCQ